MLPAVDHPLHSIRQIANEVLSQINGLFARMYEADVMKGGARPSIAPENLLRAMPLQVLCSVRSDRLLMEQVQYSLFRWLIGLSMDDGGATASGKNRERLIEHAAVPSFVTRRWS